jgi:hypothetical protein
MASCCAAGRVRSSPFRNTVPDTTVDRRRVMFSAAE